MLLAQMPEIVKLESGDSKNNNPQAAQDDSLTGNVGALAASQMLPHRDINKWRAENEARRRKKMNNGN